MERIVIRLGDRGFNFKNKQSLVNQYLTKQIGLKYNGGFYMDEPLSIRVKLFIRRLDFDGVEWHYKSYQGSLWAMSKRVMEALRDIVYEDYSQVVEIRSSRHISNYSRIEIEVQEL